MKPPRFLILACGILIACTAPFSLSKTALGQEPQASPPFEFKGHLLVSLSDADMVPSAYIDGKLGPEDGVDALSVIRLDRPGRVMHAVEIPISNSVIGPPVCLAVTPDGRYAIAIETHGPRPKANPNPKFTDLPLGRKISVIDLSDPDRPQVVQCLQSLVQPMSVSINAQGSLVAVSFNPSGDGKATPLAVYRFSGGRLSAPITPVIPGWTRGDSLTDVEFSPKENVLALLNVTKLTLSFVRVADAGGRIDLSRWGNSVAVEPGPFVAHFTPDGRYAVVNASPAGPGPPRGAVQVVRLSAAVAADGSPEHQIVSRAETGVLPEGLSISPNGQWVVTTNLEHSDEPLDSPKQGFFSSITLLHLDPATGLLDRIGDFAFDGMLPEAAAFDDSSRFLAVTKFEFFDPRHKGGSVDFWRIAGDYFDAKRVELVKMNFSVPVTRGPQSMVIVR